MDRGVATQQNREFPTAYQGIFFEEQGIGTPDSLIASIHCQHACFAPAERDLFSPAFLQKRETQMADQGWCVLLNTRSDPGPCRLSKRFQFSTGARGPRFIE